MAWDKMVNKTLKQVLKDIEHEVELIRKREKISTYGFFKNRKEK